MTGRGGYTNAWKRQPKALAEFCTSAEDRVFRRTCATLCGMKFQTQFGSSASAGSTSRQGSASVGGLVPVTASAEPLRTLTEYGEPTGAKVEALCGWRRAYAYKTHLGGGNYGALRVNGTGVSPVDTGGYWPFRAEETQPCTRLGKGVKSDPALLALTKKGGCPECSGVRATDDDFTVVRNGLGEPLFQYKTLEMLTVIRPAQTLAAACVMRMIYWKRNGTLEPLDDADCLLGGPEDATRWDPRCFAEACVKASAPSAVSAR
jgi:hypothetical protein